MERRKKQFIAGAVCPKCSDMDSLVLYRDDQSVECVSCNYQQTSQQRDAEAENENSDNQVKVSNKNQNKAKFKDASMINITNIDD